jgi:hypothetical protein
MPTKFPPPPQKKMDLDKAVPLSNGKITIRQARNLLAKNQTAKNTTWLIAKR